MKLAILILCHKNPEQINCFLDALYHPNIKFFIHVDRKANITDNLIKREDVFLLPDNKRILTKWGGVSLVQATLNLTEYAFSKDKFDYFWLCSGQDFPIKTTEEIISFLKQNPTKEYLSLSSSKAICGKSTNFDKRNALYYPKWMLGNSLCQCVLKRLYIELTGGYNRTILFNRKNKIGFTFYYGSQWWCLTYNMVNWILEYVKKHKEFLDFYKNTVVPDESFFHTLVMNSPFAKNRCATLHYIDWSEGRNSPKTLTIKDLSSLESSSYLMARKFDSNSDSEIINTLLKNQRKKTVFTLKPKRILEIVSSLGIGGGVNTVVMNWYRNIDKNKIQFDFLYFECGLKETFEKEIKQLGGCCYCLPNPLKNPFKFLKESYKFFKMHRYNTIHSHITHLNLFYYALAKIFGTKNLIQHSHGTKWSDKKISGIRNYLMLHAVWPLITHKIGCSQAAGEVYFGKNFTVANNGVDTDKFIYNPAVRELKRRELEVENNFVISNIGRFNLQKNHKFLIEIFAEIIKKDKTAKLLLVGTGPLEKEIKALVADKKLQDKVIFLGVRKDVPELLQAFDVLCMPSLYEGLPVVGVEAQGTGLPCVFADTITKEVLLLPDSKMLSLDDSAEKWAEVIISLKILKRSSGKKFLKEKGFDIKDVAKKMQGFYLSLTGN